MLLPVSFLVSLEASGMVSSEHLRDIEEENEIEWQMSITHFLFLNLRFKSIHQVSGRSTL